MQGEKGGEGCLVRREDHGYSSVIRTPAVFEVGSCCSLDALGQLVTKRLSLFMQSFRAIRFQV